MGNTDHNIFYKLSVIENKKKTFKFSKLKNKRYFQLLKTKIYPNSDKQV